MSEQNILNPTAKSLFNFDYGYTEGLPELRAVFQARSGNFFSRQQLGLGRVYDLAWNGRDLTTKLAFQQWENQYRDDYFSLADWDEGRYYTGRFDSPLSYSPRGNNTYDIKGRFIELPGKKLFQNPTNWGRDSVFLEERNSAGEDLVKLGNPANWTHDVQPGTAHGGDSGRYFSGTTNETAEWLYFGYGFRYWANKENDAGIVEVTTTRVRDGLVFHGPFNVDLYSAGTVAAAPLYSEVDLPLDFWRLKLRVTGTKNVASSAFICIADALEIMR